MQLATVYTEINIKHYLYYTSFAPRIKGLGRQKLYAFINQKISEQETQAGFKPHQYIKENVIYCARSQSEVFLM